MRTGTSPREYRPKPHFSLFPFKWTDCWVCEPLLKSSAEEAGPLLSWQITIRWEPVYSWLVVSVGGAMIHWRVVLRDSCRGMYIGALVNVHHYLRGSSFHDSVAPARMITQFGAFSYGSLARFSWAEFAKVDHLQSLLWWEHPFTTRAPQLEGPLQVTC